MLNSSPSDSFSVKLKSSLTNLISILTQQNQKQQRTSKKQQNQQTHNEIKNPSKPTAKSTNPST